MTTFMTYKKECESLRLELKHMTDQYNAAIEAEQVRYRQVVEKDAEIERLNNSLRDQFCYCVGQHCHKLGVCQTCKKPVAGWFDVAQQALEAFGAAQVEMYAKKEELAAIQAREQQLLKKVENYKILCQDENHYSHYLDALEALAIPQDTSALEAMITKAGEVMRERTHSVMLNLKPWDHRGEIIRALPAVTLDDLKC